MPAEFKITLTSGECFGFDNAKDFKRKRKELRGSAKKKEVRDILQNISINPGNVVLLWIDNVYLGEAKSHGISKPLKRKASLELFYEVDRRTPHIFDYYLIQGTNVIVKLNYDYIRERGLYVGQTLENAKGYKEGKETFIASELNKLLQEKKSE